MLFIILISKIKPTTGKKKLIYFSLQIFRTPKRCTKDINIKFYHNNNPYIQMLFIQKTARLLIRPLCLIATTRLWFHGALSLSPLCLSQAWFSAFCGLGHSVYLPSNYYMQVNSLRVKSNVASILSGFISNKWYPHYCGYHLFCCWLYLLL